MLQFVVESAFEFGFSQENNLNSWRKCGAAPLTRCCLENHSQVRREMGDNNDRTNQMMQDIQTANDISTHFQELNKLTNQKVTMGDTALARHQSLIERQMGNIIKNMSKEKRDELKRKLEDIDDSPDKSQIKPTLPPPKVVKTQDNLEEPSGGEINEILEASI